VYVEMIDADWAMNASADVCGEWSAQHIPRKERNEEDECYKHRKADKAVAACARSPNDHVFNRGPAARTPRDQSDAAPPWQ
jgi:hypothetical protein